jgi:hypothetical protein
MAELTEYTLSEIGKQKAESAGETQGLRYAIVNHIEDKGSSTIPELSDSVNHPQSVVRKMVNQLCKEGWLMEAGGGWD